LRHKICRSAAHLNLIDFGFCEDIGSRGDMEDFGAVRSFADRNFFSAEVYDGHAGHQAAMTVSEVLTPCFLALRREESNKPQEERLPDRSLLRMAYLKTDEAVKERCPYSGAAAATLYIMKEKFLAANIGDVRIVLGTSNGAMILTKDHRPDLPEERKRIEANGGHVTRTRTGIARVEWDLAMSRAFGDFCHKPLINAEPRIVEGIFGRENDFAVIASDGIWGSVEAEEAISLARNAPGLDEAAEAIADRAKEMGSKDNILVIVISLRKISCNCKEREMKILHLADEGLLPTLGLPRAEKLV